jgi:type IV secretory pathway protease TraF
MDYLGRNLDATFAADENDAPPIALFHAGKIGAAQADAAQHIDFKEPPPVVIGNLLERLLTTDTNEIILDRNEYFVIGDNATNSLDSRYFGSIKRNHIKGKAILIYWPFDRKRMLE